VSSVVGFAFSALAGAALMHLYDQPAEAVEIMVLCSIAIQLYCVIAVHRSIQWRLLVPFLVGGAAFAPVGVWMLSEVSGEWFALGLGTFLLAYGALMIRRRAVRIEASSWWLDLLVGGTGGITGGLAAFPSAFVTIWCSMRGWDKFTQRAVYQPYILAMQIVTIICLRAIAPSHGSVAGGLIFVPFALLGAIAGLAVFQRLTNRQFQVAVGLLLAASGAGLLARAF